MLEDMQISSHTGMPWVGTPIDLTAVRSAPVFEANTGITLPIESPVYKLAGLKKGWDGNNAEPLSGHLLEQGQKLWEEILKLCDTSDLPQVSPGRDDVIAFAWTNHRPAKQLDIFLYGEQTFRAEYVVEVKGVDCDSHCISLTGLLRVIRNYLQN